MELDKDIKQQLAGLIADPSLVSSNDTALLDNLLLEYPYYQPLHLLRARANMQQEENKQVLAKTALYTNGKLLHNFLYSKLRFNAAFNIPSQASEIVSEIASAEETDEQEVFEEITEVDHSLYRPFTNGTTTQELNIDSQEPEPYTQESDEREAKKSKLEDSFVFDSIASSDFFAFEENFSPENVEQPKMGETADPFPEYAISRNIQRLELNKKPGGVDQQSGELSQQSDGGPSGQAGGLSEQRGALSIKATDLNNLPGAENDGRVSNYNDENLPYTFLWWLAKTRKEHQDTFQPYATPKRPHSAELQQQYVEHIFHVQSHLTGEETLADEIDHSKPPGKDFEIIENFIRKDPQINPPNAEQIDNENKARKSAEDQNDMVSETLANIYIEQMLYDKAIDTYQKLSLKFPEKSRYFADLIQSIEKKI